MWPMQRPTVNRSSSVMPRSFLQGAPASDRRKSRMQPMMTVPRPRLWAAMAMFSTTMPLSISI